MATARQVLVDHVQTLKTGALSNLESFIRAELNDFTRESIPRIVEACFEATRRLNEGEVLDRVAETVPDEVAVVEVLDGRS